MAGLGLGPVPEPPGFMGDIPERLRTASNETPLPEAMILLNVLGEISRRVSAAYGVWLRPHGIDFSEYVALWALWLRDPQPAPVSFLRKQVVMSSGGIALALKRLERKELVRRDRSSADARIVLVQLTGQGRALISGLVDADLQRHEALWPDAGEQDRTAVLYGLTDILARLHSWKSDE